jgi:hypothetical protein
MEPGASLPLSTRAHHLSLSWASSIQSMPPFHFLKINFNITLLSTPGPPKWPPSLRSPHQNPVCTSHFSHTCYITSNKNSRYQIKAWSASESSFVTRLSVQLCVERMIIIGVGLPKPMPLLVAFLLICHILFTSNASFSFALSRYVPPLLTFWSWIEQRRGVWRLWLMIYLRVPKDKCKIDAGSFVLFI